MKSLYHLIISVSLLVGPVFAQQYLTQPQPQPGYGVDEYNMGLMDGQNAVNNDGVMYGVYGCGAGFVGGGVGTCCLGIFGMPAGPALGAIPVAMAMAGEPGISGYPKMQSSLYVQGYNQALQSKKAQVKSARLGWSIGGCLLGSAIGIGLGLLGLYLLLPDTLEI